MGYYDDTERKEAMEQESRETFRAAQPEKKPSRMRGVLSSVISGVVGGALVLGVQPYFEEETGNNQPSYSVDSNTAQENSTNEVNTQPISATNDIADMVENLSPAIVGISNKQQQRSFGGGTQSAEAGTGSGVIFKKDGNTAYIITNNHVIEGASSIEITYSDGEKSEAELVGADPLTDTAVLKIDSKYAKAVAQFGDSGKLRAGERVVAIGNPLGLDFSRTVTEGIISGTDRTVPIETSEGNWDLSVIQTDAAINPGNSGGPLLNMSGQVIGINSLKITQDGVEGIGFAIPSNDLQPIVDELLEKGKVDRPFLGVGLIDLSQVPEQYRTNTLQLPNDVTEGVFVQGVSPGSPASEAGMKEGDVIVAMNGTKIKSSGELRKFLYSQTAIGDEIDVEFYRQGEKVTEKVKLSQKEVVNS
ncbi:trypsin-like peptidase domain-containing protein [Metabacillus indicus]|uniref:S1C family serine protease n=1 Tax=Metabacillus indicus TaxID=246786 RepID=UPI002A0812F6|nr:trypsin-like peptidase domain-containing protein [Metabacillus indicus]MDX8288735.1 trypsin-like peptidase domain-containing protein [Metabacillus indicus]